MRVWASDKGIIKRGECMYKANEKELLNAITFYDSRFTDVATANTILADVEVVYPLATPITLSFTSQDIPTLLGENNIWCDTGDTEVKFLLTVGKKIS